MVIDFYEGGNVAEVDKITVFWSDTFLNYWGYMYKQNELLGDFSTPDCLEVEKTFSHLKINWD